MNTGFENAAGKWKPKTLSSRSLRYAPNPTATAMLRDGVFQDQVPPDDPGEDFAQGRVRVGIGAAGDRNHGGQLGVAQAPRSRRRWPPT